MKYLGISLSPNLPAHKNNDIHSKCQVQLSFYVLYCFVYI
jgi:hypothetical protein